MAASDLTKRIKALGYSVKGFSEQFGFSLHTVYALCSGNTGKRCLGVSAEIVATVDRLERERSVTC